MACCLFAAFLFAQCMAMLRRWGMFWGIVRVPQGEVADTFYTRVAAWSARPRVRLVTVTLLAFELAGVGGWLYLEHGAHLAAIASAVAGTAHPERAEAGICRGDTAALRSMAGPATRAAAEPQLRRL